MRDQDSKNRQELVLLEQQLSLMKQLKEFTAMAKRAQNVDIPDANVSRNATLELNYLLSSAQTQNIKEEIIDPDYTEADSYDIPLSQEELVCQDEY